MATTENTTVQVSDLRDFLPANDLGGIRADDPLKVGFYAALLPAGAPRQLITRSAVLGAQVELVVTPADTEPHTVVITVDEFGAVEGMMTFIGDDGWQHTLRTAERTLRHLAANADRDVLGMLRDEADPCTALYEEINDLDDEVYAQSTVAYRYDDRGVVANPDAPESVKKTMARLAEAMVDRDGVAPAWARPVDGVTRAIEEPPAAHAA
jgi:hypothetical protein